jgi:nucleoside-diphosphate-sugar epimerase
MTIKTPKLTVLVTGATGMIGRRLVPALVAAGHRVICLIRQNSKHAFTPDVEIISGDLTDLNFCKNSVSSIDSLSAIIHLAGMGSVVEVEADPQAATVCNVGITKNLLSAAAAHNVKRFIFSSTGLVYGPGHFDSIDESVPANPISEYAKTKYLAEQCVVKYAKEKRLSAEILRFSNIYSSDSSTSTVLGRILNQLRLKKPIQVQSTLPIRDFIFVDDIVKALLALMTIAESHGYEITNVSSGVGLSIGEIVDIAKSIAGESFEPAHQVAVDNKDRFVLSNEKLKLRTGWRPQTSIKEGLRLSLDHLI